jgi:hypothetical protein
MELFETVAFFMVFGHPCVAPMQALSWNSPDGGIMLSYSSHGA